MQTYSFKLYDSAKFKIKYQTFRGCCLFISGMLQLNKTRASYETNLNKFKFKLIAELQRPKAACGAPLVRENGSNP